jgi:hypothetical protein
LIARGQGDWARACFRVLTSLRTQQPDATTRLACNPSSDLQDQRTALHATRELSVLLALSASRLIGPEKLTECQDLQNDLHGAGLKSQQHCIAPRGDCVRALYVTNICFTTSSKERSMPCAGILWIGSLAPCPQTLPAGFGRTLKRINE